MIYAFTGLVGSGKTYTMVKKAYYYWKRGINIYSNTFLLFSKYPISEQQKGLNIVMHPKDFNLFEHLLHKIKQPLYKKLKREYEIPTKGRIIYFDTIEEIQNAKDGIVLFDEGQVLFSSSSWKEIADEFKYKVSQERKHDLDFFTTTRRFRSILIDYRQEVHNWFYFKQIIALKVGKKNKKRLIIGLFARYEKDLEAVNENLPDRDNPNIKTRYFFITKWNKKLYDTKYDIGFKPLKLIKQHSNNKDVWKTQYFILPTRMTLKEGLQLISSTNRQ